MGKTTYAVCLVSFLLQCWSHYQVFVCAHAVVLGAGSTVVIDDGFLVKQDGDRGHFVGRTTSILQKHVIDELFAPINASAWDEISIIDETVVRTLDMRGDYVADAKLHLPSLFRLRLNGSISIKPGFKNDDRFGALVMIEGSKYSAVLGGHFNASGDNGFSAISLVSASRCSVQGVRATSDTDVININDGELNEVAQSDLGPGGGRCIWLLATRRAMVHHNTLHGCSSHSLDFDAYTKDSVAYNNNVTGSDEEGIFVEETASNNVVAGNTLAHNPTSIGVYSNAVGPVSGNLFIGNAATEGISVGGMGHDPNKHSEQNVFINNDFGHGGANIHHGETQGDYWTNNVNHDQYVGDPGNNAAVTIFEPGKKVKTGQGVGSE